MVRMRRGRPRLAYRVIRRSLEGRKSLQREPKRVRKREVTMTDPWQVPTNVVRLKSSDGSVFREVTNAEGASFMGYITK